MLTCGSGRGCEGSCNCKSLAALNGALVNGVELAVIVVVAAACVMIGTGIGTGNRMGIGCGAICIIGIGMIMP